MLTDHTKYRIYEMLPAISIWLTLILAVLLSFVKPLWMIYAVIIFDIYWVIKVLNFTFYLLVAWSRFRKVVKVDWKGALVHEIPEWKTYRHVVFLTVYNESWPVVKSSLESISNAAYDPEQIMIVVAGEERTKKHCEDIFAKVKKHFTSSFGCIKTTLHPVGLENEIPGKGSNLHYSERVIKKHVDKQGWDYDKLIVTIFDIDTICHEQYFAYLTYLYATHPRPTRVSYQPVALYNNNVWESPAILRVMSFSTTFWSMMSLARQDHMVTFSSHSMSFRALVDAGFHDKKIVSEDSRIFYQCLLKYDGDYAVIPMYMPVSMDSVRDDSFKKSMRNLYLQQRRWAWGVEHVPYLLWEFGKKGNKIPFSQKFKWVFIEWEGKWSWCLVALIITILGWLPLQVAGPEVRQSALFFNAPHLLQTLMNISMLGLILSAMLTVPLLPKKPESHPRHVYIIMVLQWILLPISLIVISAIPAIDAVTHLMFGKYLGFNVSQKKRA